MLCASCIHIKMRTSSGHWKQTTSKARLQLCRQSLQECRSVSTQVNSGLGASQQRKLYSVPEADALLLPFSVCMVYCKEPAMLQIQGRTRQTAPDHRQAPLSHHHPLRLRLQHPKQLRHQRAMSRPHQISKSRKPVPSQT